MKDRKISFGQVRNIPDNVEESRIIGFINSTYAPDRHHTILNQDGWKLDNYRKNPIVGYAHNLSGGLLTDPNPDYIIGKDIKPQIEGIGKDRKLTGLLEFEPASINPLAEKIFRKVLFGSLSRSSVGFIEVGQGKYGSGEEALGRPQEKYYFEGQELLEWSVVNIPSNANAGKRKARTLEGEPIGTTCYVIQQLADRFRPSYLEKLPIDDIMVLLEAKDLNIKETDPGKVRKLLADPQAVADRIELERFAFRKAQEARKIISMGAKTETSKEQNNFETIKIHKMKKKTYLLNLINKSLRKEELDEDELEITNIANRQKKDCGLGHLNLRNGISIPFSLPSTDEIPDPGSGKRTILTQQYLISKKQEYLINPVSDASVFINKAKALFLPLQMSDIKVPSFSGILASWADDETDPDSDGAEITISGATFQNKRLWVCLDIPEKLIRQGGPEADQWLRDNITAALANKIDSTLGGILASGTNKPQGMGYAITTGQTTKQNAKIPEYSDLCAMESALGDLKAPIENFAWITNAAGRSILRNIVTPGGGYVYDYNELLNYPVYVSNLVSGAAGADGLGELLLFGNWKDLAIVQFGAYDIVADPYTLKAKGKIQLHVNAYYDFKGLRGSLTTGATEANQYAYSFTSLAIK